jgi:predicted MFS family arabinose efflux permease
VLPEDLAWANGTIAVGANLGYLVGPAVGGLLLAVTSARTVFLANAVSFVISAGLVASVGGSFSGLRTGDDEHAHRGIRAGIRFVRRDPVLKVMVVAAAVFAVTVGATLVAQLPLATSFGRGSIGYGLIATSFGLGALIGSLAGRRITERTEMTVMPLCCLVTAAGFGAVAFAPTFAFVLVAMVVAGASDGAGDVAFELIFQRRSPDAVRSRTIAVLETVFLIGLAVSFPIAGPLVDALGPRVAYVVAGLGVGLAALLMVPLIRTSRALRAEALGQDPRGSLHVQGDASA